MNHTKNYNQSLCFDLMGTGFYINNFMKLSHKKLNAQESQISAIKKRNPSVLMHIKQGGNTADLKAQKSTTRGRERLCGIRPDKHF